MDDSDSISIGMIVLIQLLFVGMLMTALFVFTGSVFSEDRFQETVYAIDNALLADALLVQNTGTMRAAYLFNQAYQVELQDPFVRLSQTDSSLISRRFSSREAVEVADGTHETRLLHWVRRPNALAVSALSIAERCPHAGDITSVSSARYLAVTGFSGDLYDAINRGFLRHGLNPQQVQSVLSRSGVSADFIIFTERHNQQEFVVRHGQGIIAERAGCLVQQELALAGFEATLQEDTSLQDTAILLLIPDSVDIPQQARALGIAIGQGLMRVVR